MCHCCSNQWKMLSEWLMVVVAFFLGRLTKHANKQRGSALDLSHSSLISIFNVYQICPHTRVFPAGPLLEMASWSTHLFSDGTNFWHFCCENVCVVGFSLSFHSALLNDSLRATMADHQVKKLFGHERENNPFIHSARSGAPENE